MKLERPSLLLLCDWLLVNTWKMLDERVEKKRRNDLARVPQNLSNSLVWERATFKQVYARNVFPKQQRVRSEPVSQSNPTTNRIRRLLQAGARRRRTTFWTRKRRSHTLKSLEGVRTIYHGEAIALQYNNFEQRRTSSIDSNPQQSDYCFILKLVVHTVNWSCHLRWLERMNRCRHCQIYNLFKKISKY